MTKSLKNDLKLPNPLCGHEQETKLKKFKFQYCRCVTGQIKACFQCSELKKIGTEKYLGTEYFSRTHLTPPKTNGPDTSAKQSQ